MNITGDRMKFLRLLSEKYPTRQQVCTEIINLQAILNLPKGTEHFMSDLHGEYEAFFHILNNSAGVIREKVDMAFEEVLTARERSSLCTLIYYPQEKLRRIREEGRNTEEWYRFVLQKLIDLAKLLSSKYTRSKVRKALPENYRYIIEELITEKKEVLNKTAYYDEIINTIIEIGCADDFIIEMSHLIQQLVIDHLHIIGDIYDRGYGSHFVMDSLMKYHSLDIQWGNHDVLWMGAGAGQTACIANIVRTSLLYDNLSVLENGYGISIMPLALFAMDIYKDDPCSEFAVKSRHSSTMDNETQLSMKMQKAIAVIQFKLEGRLIKEHPEYKMDNRLMLDKINIKNGSVTIDGKSYAMRDLSFPTVDFNEPYTLTKQEQLIIDKLRNSFINCKRLREHIKLLLNKGGLYKVCNNNLLFHGCIPMNDDGTFRKINLFGTELSGKALYDELEIRARKAFLIYCGFCGMVQTPHCMAEIK